MKILTLNINKLPAKLKLVEIKISDKNRLSNCFKSVLEKISKEFKTTLISDEDLCYLSDMTFIYSSSSLSQTAD